MPVRFHDRASFIAAWLNGGEIEMEPEVDSITIPEGYLVCEYPIHAQFNGGAILGGTLQARHPTTELYNGEIRCGRTGASYDAFELYALRHWREQIGGFVAEDMSFAHGTDGCLDLSWIVKGRITRCTIGEGLSNAGHIKGQHSTGGLAKILPGGRVTYEYCLFHNNVARNPHPSRAWEGEYHIEGDPVAPPDDWIDAPAEVSVHGCVIVNGGPIYFLLNQSIRASVTATWKIPAAYGNKNLILADTRVGRCELYTYGNRVMDEDIDFDYIAIQNAISIGQNAERRRAPFSWSGDPDFDTLHYVHENAGAKRDGKQRPHAARVTDFIFNPSAAKIIDDPAEVGEGV